MDRGGDAVYDTVLFWTAANAGSPRAASVILAAGTLPQIVATVAGGVIAERVGSWRMLRVTAGVKVVVAALLAVALFAGAPWPTVAACAAVMGLAEAFHISPLYALPGSIQGWEDKKSVGKLTDATQSSSQVAMLLATPLAGWLLDRGGGIAAVVCGLALVGARVMLTPLAAHIVPPKSTPPGRGIEMLREGLQFGIKDARVRVGLLTFSVANLLTASPLFLGLPLHAVQAGWPAWAWALVYAAYLVGGAIGPQLGGRIGSRSLRKAWLLLIPGGIGMGVTVSTGSAWFAIVGGLVAGASFQAGVATTREHIMTSTPATFRHRVQSLVGTAAFSLVAVSHLLFGAAAAVWSVAVIGWVCVGLLVVFACAMVTVVSSESSTSERDPSG